MTARGESVLRLEDERLLRGAGCFTADIRLENELRMFVVRSPHAAARIVSIETSDAIRRPGVVAVLTGRDYQADGWGHPTSRHKDFLGPRRNVDGSALFMGVTGRSRVRRQAGTSQTTRRGAAL